MKPRLLFVVPDLGPGGAQPMNLRLAKKLQERGWPVRVAVLFDRQRVLGEEACRGLDIRVLGKRGWLGQWEALAQLSRLACSADIVIGGVECAATTYGYFAAQKVNLPFVAWMHTAFDRHEEKLGILDRWLSHCVYRKSRWVVFPSQGSLDSLALALGGRPERASWQVIENFYQPRAARSEGDFAKSTDDEWPILLGIGRLDLQSKSFDRLVRIHAALLAKGIKGRSEQPRLRDFGRAKRAPVST